MRTAQKLVASDIHEIHIPIYLNELNNILYMKVWDRWMIFNRKSELYRITYTSFIDFSRNRFQEIAIFSKKYT